MSYSFRASARSRRELLEEIEAKLYAVYEAQPVHNHDIMQALNVSTLYVHLAPQPEDDKLIHADVNGSVWMDGEVCKQVSIGVNISYGPAPKQEPEPA